VHESAIGVRRGKAALSSGCKSHPATAPAGSNRGRELPHPAYFSIQLGVWPKYPIGIDLALLQGFKHLVLKHDDALPARIQIDQINAKGALKRTSVSCENFKSFVSSLEDSSAGSSIRCSMIWAAFIVEHRAAGRSQSRR
jgi:hypothetical protein